MEYIKILLIGFISGIIITEIILYLTIKTNLTISIKKILKQKQMQDKLDLMIARERELTNSLLPMVGLSNTYVPHEVIEDMINIFFEKNDCTISKNIGMDTKIKYLVNILNKYSDECLQWEVIFEEFLKGYKVEGNEDRIHHTADLIKLGELKYSYCIHCQRFIKEE